MSVPNQKIVQISPRTKRNSQNLFATMNLIALQQAMRDLKGSSFKLWTYLNKNQDNYRFELSQKACAEWGIKKDSYYSAVKDLIEKRYLVPLTQESNIFCFYEMPLSENQQNFSEKQNEASEIQFVISETPRRNNTNNTIIKQNKTKGVKGKNEYPPEHEMISDLYRFWKFGMNKYSIEERNELYELLEKEELTESERRKLNGLYNKYLSR